MRIGQVNEVSTATGVNPPTEPALAKEDVIIKQTPKEDGKGTKVEQAPENEALEPVVAGGVTFPAGTKISKITKFERSGISSYQPYGSVGVDMPNSHVSKQTYYVAILPDNKGTVTIPANKKSMNELDSYERPLQYKNAFVDIDENGKVIFNNVYFTELQGTDNDDTFVFRGYQKNYKVRRQSFERESYFQGDKEVQPPKITLAVAEVNTTFPRGAEINTGKGNDSLEGQLGATTTNYNPHYIHHLKPSETKIKADGNLKIEGQPTHYLEIDVEGELDLTNVPISPSTFTGGVKAKLPEK